MFLAQMEIKGFRGLDTRVSFGDDLTLLTGENNVGKSAVIDAIRLLAGRADSDRSRTYLRPGDFSHDARGDVTTTEIQISYYFESLSPEERGIMATCLAPQRGPSKAVLTLRGTLTPELRVKTRWGGGDLFNEDIEPIARAAVEAVYLPPLRDAERDLRPGPANRVRQLAITLNDPKLEAREKLESVSERANRVILNSDLLRMVDKSVSGSLLDLTGGSAFKQQTSLQFSPSRFERILSNLRLLIGRDLPVDLDESGLGYNNLLYMAVLLSALRRSTEAPLRLLLVEEPEAHLHPDLQSLLSRYLVEQSGRGLQVISTTHSPLVAASVGVERITAIAKNGQGASIANALVETGLNEKQSRHLKRFLDATKSTLLFSRGVLLVEGIAEQLMVPVLAERLGIDLRERGIVVVNVAGLSFRPFAGLFSSQGLPGRCAIVTDGDPTAQPEANVEDWAPSAVAQGLSRDFSSGQVRAFVALKTFEWDMARLTVNRPALTEAYASLHPRSVGTLPVGDLDDDAWADSFLKAIHREKGDFALELSETLSRDEQGRATISFQVPEYLRSALLWVASEVESGEV